MTIRSFKDLRTWQEAHKLCVDVYRVTSKFPRNEIYGLTSQMRRAAVSVASNIAEGMGRNSTNDRIRFFIMSRGSTQELLSQLELAKDLGFLKLFPYSQLTSRYNGLAAGINKHIKHISASTP